MNARLARALELSKLTLIRLSAPKLTLEPRNPVRPPMFRATATLGEMLMAKGVTL